MNYSSHYNLNLAEGTDLVNPLTVDVPNYQTIDDTMFANEQAGVGTATELKSGSIHALTRANQNRDVFKFKSTSVYNVGDTFTVDGGSVTALAVDGSSLKDRCFIIGSDVLCILNGTQLTVLATYVPDTINASSVYPMETSPSTHNYAIGDHLIVDGTTYIAKTAISIGDSLVINTNIEAETLGTRMNNIEQDISTNATTISKMVKAFTYSTSVTFNNEIYVSLGYVASVTGGVVTKDNILGASLLGKSFTGFLGQSSDEHSLNLFSGGLTPISGTWDIKLVIFYS